MNQILTKNFSECQNALINQGYCLTSFNLPHQLKEFISQENFKEIDEIFKKLLKYDGDLFKFLASFTQYDISHIEHIISLRDSDNEWEEDGIWHDDGSRVLAFSLSLTLGLIEGGVLEFRKKQAEGSLKIPTPAYGDVIIFKTGVDEFEHKINRVIKGKRLIIAGWLYPSK